MNQKRKLKEREAGNGGKETRGYKRISERRKQKKLGNKIVGNGREGMKTTG